MPASHDALYTIVILDQILYFLDVDPDDRSLPNIDLKTQSLRCIASVAKTCRAFLDPALDVLWREMQSLVPLLKCFPDNVWKIDAARHKMILCRRPKQGDWDRVLYYSRRIRKLYPPMYRLSLEFSSNDCDIHPKFFDALVYPDAPILLPNLQELHWITNANKQTVYKSIGQLLLGPNLARVVFSDIVLLALVTQPVDIFNEIKSRLAPLRSIEIEICERSDVFKGKAGRRLSKFIRSLNNIQSISFPDFSELDGSYLMHLASLPTLMSLHLDMNSQSHTSTLTQSCDMFSALVCFTVNCAKLTHATALLRTVSSPYLQIVAVDISTAALSPTAVHDFFSAMTDGPALLTIQEIVIATTNPVQSRIAQSTRSAALCDLERLFVLPNVRRFSVQSNIAYNKDDVLLEKMSKAWPQLEVLELAGDIVPRTSPKVTLGGVLILARNCPRLQMLALSVDATVVPEHEDADSRPRGPLLEYIQVDVVTSRIIDPEPVAEFLLDIFPALKTVRSTLSPMGLGNVGRQQDSFTAAFVWKLVDQHIRNLLAVNTDGSSNPDSGSSLSLNIRKSQPEIAVEL